VGSDRARIGFDPSRDYRAVVAQQGRVTLEADINEETAIAGEALRLETIDVVGPAGTPEQTGYQVSYDAKLGLVVAPGTMYAGGWRLTLDNAVPLDDQPDWLDMLPAIYRSGVAANEEDRSRSLVALLVSEQSISATEDQALREVALGGPDTSARTRLMQHFVSIPTPASLCNAAQDDVGAMLAKMGLSLDPATLALGFDADLKVGFYPPTQRENPCCPPAQGGYLGADNQLVRVTVSSFSAPSGTLLWGWNNASFLYRATVAGSRVLRLDQVPVDAVHTPQPGQAIEILQTEAVLGDPVDSNYVAAPLGQIITLGSGTVYDPATQKLTLPPGTTLPAGRHTLFVRLWQAEVPFTSGKRVNLDDASGLAVTVRIKALPTWPLQARPFWCFAVRPNTPQMVYPRRYLEAPQLPDGPRQWLCDLAIVERKLDEIGWVIVADCRKHFKPLTDNEECACCCLVLSAAEEWRSKLNAAIASRAKALCICFQPGEFKVDSKIVFTGQSVKMIGAGEGTLLAGIGLEAVIEFDNCPNVNIADLSVVAGVAGYSNNPATAGLQGAVTLRDCAQVDIERVFLACAGADLRAASCLAVYNTVPATSQVAPRYNVRVLNSQFNVGHFQVGILLVNADRAQIEGNLVVTEQTARNVKIGDLAANTALASRLRKQLVNSMTIVNTAPPAAKKAKRRVLKKQKKNTAGTSVPVNAPMVAPVPAEPAPAAETQPAAAAPSKTEEINAAILKPPLPPINLGELGRARINATFGTLKLEFISTGKLTNAWTEALRTAGLTQTSTAGDLHRAVLKIAETVFKAPDSVAPAFRNWVNAVLPNLYSTSSQGIVVGGDLANDIRILNNTIDGAAQGIHVGLSDCKADPVVSHLSVSQVQICGNTINIRITPEMTGDRHGIFLGSVNSAIVSDNHMVLYRSGEAGTEGGQATYAIKAVGAFGRRVLIERNCMLRFTLGLYLQPSVDGLPNYDLWMAAENVSTSANYTSCFKVGNNIP
jgi:hypothetical protein